MKKSLIWMLMAIMALTFGTLLYFQIIYLENMVKMREGQFSENVMRSLHSAVAMLERYETLHYLEEDVAILNSAGEDDDMDLYDQSANQAATSSPIIENDQEISRFSDYRNAAQDVSERYRKLRESLKNQYQYQQGLLNEVILTILRDAPLRPLEERADSTVIRSFLSTELENNGVTLPFTFAVAGKNNSILYMTQGFEDPTEKDVPVYSTTLFPNSGSNNYRIFVEFPTRDTYIFSSVRFIIPTLAFTAILLIIFIYTIVMIFHQKNLSEMKTDFINNMTHEFKTPISTISLAAQMLGDESVGKSPAMLKQLSGVISDESKRLRFQVEKVLQMSMYDDAGGSALKFSEVNVNSIIYNVVNTHKLKAEKDGGTIEMHLDAVNADVYLDEMHFTNVIFNLLDNAIKYMKPDTAPHLVVTTKDYGQDMIEIRIRDNGIGIKKDDLKRIFEKFFRVSTGNRHDVKGFGLGLAYVKKMVNIFKGTITAESEYGKWSEFIIRLPLVEIASPEVEA
ncbi:MAG: HAMP domain-containing histidine kinase [Muribaculaceae bacterium]|nr:HAMP domain-containing histidine kinase [Muribaculaceae bacterium]